MRWLQTKLILLALFAPVLRVFMSGRSLRLRNAVADGDFATATLLRGQLFRGTLATLVFALVVVLLGRLKPRLGQRYGRTFRRKSVGEV